MDLDEMKSIWSDMSDQVDNKQQLTNENIRSMIQQQYKQKANRIIYPEIIGALICFGFAGIFLYNFGKLDDWMNMAAGALAIAFLISLPLLSLVKMNRWTSKINVTENTYQQTLLDFTKVKRSFAKLKRYSYLLGIGSLFIILPPMAKIWKDVNVFTDPTVWYKVPFGVLGIIAFVFFTMRFYGSSINQIDEMLQDVEEENGMV